MAASMVSCTKCRYVLHFAHEHLEFRLTELKSIARLFGVKLELPADYNEQNPFLITSFPTEECARNVAKRGVLIKSAFQLWAQGDTYGDLITKLHKLPTAFTAPYTNADVSFRLKVDTFNRVLTQQEKVQRIQRVLDGSLPFDGPVKLKDPRESFHLLEFYGEQGTAAPSEPYQVYFGRWISDGQRDTIQALHLQKRKFIGNTSMEAGLSLLMANMALLKANSLVFDPFVGSGSLLVAGAQVGAYVLGADIDYNIIHGRGRASRSGQKWRTSDDCILANLRQYGLGHRFIDVLLADSSKWPMWRQRSVFDAIVTDPPYGIREPTTKVDEESRTDITDKQSATFVPRKVDYELADILKDLLNFAARYLKVGGRLVYWLPVYRPDYTDDNVPCHSCLALVANSEQAFTVTFGRRLVTMEKVREFEEGVSSEATMNESVYVGASLRELYFTPNAAAAVAPPGGARKKPPTGGDGEGIDKHSDAS